MKKRHTFTATIMVALLAVAGVTAAIAADPPPPRIAFVANGRVPADALAAGPTAGQLGAPIYTTEQDSLPTATSDALDAYNPQLVIVLGGPVAIAEPVVDAIAAVTSLPKVDASPPPTTGVVRAAGADRFATAAAIADLLGDYNPAALPADAKAVDSDKLDGKDSSAFQPAGDYLGKTEKAADSDKLDGNDSSAFVQTNDVAMAATDTTVNTSSSVNPNLFDISMGAGTLLLDFDISCASFSGTSDTRWDVSLELNGTAEWSGLVLFFPHNANSSVGDSASMSVAVEVPAGTHTVGYSASRSGGDGSLDCNIHARGQGLPVTGTGVSSASSSATSTSSFESPQGATLP